MYTSNQKLNLRQQVFTNQHILNLIIKHLNCKPTKRYCVGKKPNGERCKSRPMKGCCVLCRSHNDKFINEGYNFDVFYRSKQLKVDRNILDMFVLYEICI